MWRANQDHVMNWRLFFLMVCVLMSAGCLQTENSSALDKNLYGGPEVADPEFAAAAEVFEARCSGASCHAFQNSSSAELVTDGLVVAGDAEGSEIYNRIRGSSGSQGAKNMPPSTTIPTAEADVIKAWINALN